MDQYVWSWSNIFKYKEKHFKSTRGGHFEAHYNLEKKLAQLYIFVNANLKCFFLKLVFEFINY